LHTLILLSQGKVDSSLTGLVTRKKIEAMLTLGAAAASRGAGAVVPFRITVTKYLGVCK